MYLVNSTLTKPLLVCSKLSFCGVGTQEGLILQTLVWVSCVPAVTQRLDSVESGGGHPGEGREEATKSWPEINHRLLLHVVSESFQILSLLTTLGFFTAQLGSKSKHALEERVEIACSFLV